jgi:hypothetical protein
MQVSDVKIDSETFHHKILHRVFATPSDIQNMWNEWYIYDM